MFILSNHIYPHLITPNNLYWLHLYTDFENVEYQKKIFSKTLTMPFSFPKLKNFKISEQSSSKTTSEATTSKNFKLNSKRNMLFRTLHNFNSKFTVLYFIYLSWTWHLIVSGVWLHNRKFFRCNSCELYINKIRN